MNSENLVTIYVILLNDEEVYVGYSRDLKERWSQYRSAYMKPESVLHKEMVTQFMVRHGWYNFTIQIVEEAVPKFGVIDRIEYWVEMYKLIGCEMLNKVKTGITKTKIREICNRCGLQINGRDKARHQRSIRCQLLHRGFAA